MKEEKYAGDTKRLLKIDVAKDKIAELRLRQRVSGTFGVTAEVAARDKTIGDFESQAMNRAIAKNTPKWIRKIPYMYKPFWKIDELYSNRKDRELQRAHTKTAGLYWCGFAAAATFFPGALTYIKFGAPLILVSHLAQRGPPPVPSSERGMAGAVRDPNYGDYLWSAALLTAHSVIGNFIAGFAVPFTCSYARSRSASSSHGCMAHQARLAAALGVHLAAVTSTASRVSLSRGPRKVLTQSPSSRPEDVERERDKRVESRHRCVSRGESHSCRSSRHHCRPCPRPIRSSRARGDGKGTRGCVTLEGVDAACAIWEAPRARPHSVCSCRSRMPGRNAPQTRRRRFPRARRL